MARNNEDVADVKIAAKYILVSVVIVVLLLFFGGGLLLNLTDIVSVYRGPGKRFIADTTPPAPPIFDALPSHTNTAQHTISGNAEPGSSVFVSVNSTTQEVLVNNEGRFSIIINLESGENIIKAYAQDTAGNQSNITSNQNIIYDTEKPEINLIKPTDGEQFYGNSQKRLTVEGETELSSEVTINGRVVHVNSGRFTHSYDLSEGQNDINIKSTDQAGNQTETTISVHFTP